MILINDPSFIPGSEDVNNPDLIPPTGAIRINNDSQCLSDTWTFDIKKEQWKQWKEIKIP